MPVDIGTGAWCRVTQRDRCPVCDSDTWCTVAPNGSAARCKRHESDRPSPGEDGDAWIHRLNGSVDEPGPQGRDDARPKRGPNCNLLNKQYCAAITHDQVKTLATQLGVDPIALGELGIGWCARTDAFSFPMFNAGGDIIGIRHRPRGPGHKFAERGGNNGVFRCRTPNGEGPLFICEGESDLAALLSYGLDGIAVPGTGQCVDVAASFGKGRDVVVVADRDEAGERGAEKLRAKLVEVARSVRVIVPPSPHKDLRAWRRAGATRRDIEAAVAAVRHTDRERRHTTVHMLSELRDLPPVRWVVAGIVPCGVGFLCSPPNTGKSTLAIDVAMRVYHGLDWHGCRVRAGSVLYVVGEGLGGVAARIEAWQRAHKVESKPPDRYFAIATNLPSLSSPAGRTELEAIIDDLVREQRHAPTLVVIDTLSAHWTESEDRAEFAAPAMAAMQHLVAKHGGAIMLLHHERKPGEHARGGDLAALRGSGAWAGSADYVLSLAGKPDALTLSATKQRDAERAAPIALRLQTIDLGGTDELGRARSSVVVLPAAKFEHQSVDDRRAKLAADVEQRRAAILTTVAALGGKARSKRQIVDKTPGWRDASLFDEIDGLVADGYLVPSGRGFRLPSVVPGSAATAAAPYGASSAGSGQQCASADAREAPGSSGQHGSGERRDLE